MMSRVMGRDVSLVVGTVRICLGLAVFGVSVGLSVPVLGLDFLNRLLIFLNIKLPWLYFKE